MFEPLALAAGRLAVVRPDWFVSDGRVGGLWLACPLWLGLGSWPEPIWRVPTEQMKMEREHIVPLSSQAADLVKALRELSHSTYVFPGEKAGQPIYQNTMIYGCYRMGYRGRQTVHGFRGLASTWANEAECNRSDWIEMALAHADEDEVRSAYNSALYLSPRRRMLPDWADHVQGMIDGREAEKAPIVSAGQAA